jgi:uncharacterized protein
MKRHHPFGLRPTLAIVLLVLALASSPAPAQNPLLRDRYAKIEYMIPMRDGAKLYTSVYLPRNKPGRHPILFERTPYGAGPYGSDAYRRGFRGSSKFMDAGYIFAYQDVRGRGRSEGVWASTRPQLINPLKPHDVDESTDTWDAIDYLVKHVPNNNGRVGLWGISYPGYYAGIGAVNSHPALKVASPQAPVSDWFIGDDFHRNGALFLMDAVGFGRFGETPAVTEAYKVPIVDTQGDPFGFYLKIGTLASLTERYFAKTDGVWPEVMAHGTYDEYWQSRSMPVHLRNVRCPMLVVGGWFDAEDCWGALHTARAAFKQNPRIHTTLVMGPWRHGGWSGMEGDHLGDMRFGQMTSAYFRQEIEFPYLDAILRGNGKPALPAAKAFETGTNRWRTFAQWPPRGVKQSSLLLLPGMKVGIGGASATSGEGYDEYVSDPARPVPYQGGEIHGRTSEYMVDDQRFASTRTDVLTYESEPLKQPMTIAGPVTADLCVSTTGTDTDFVVKLIDVYPNTAPGKLAGYQNLLRGDVMRGKFRDSYQNPAPFAPGQVTHVAFEMADLLHAFLPGHRIMVQVQSSWFPLVDRNPQKFVDIYHCNATDFQKATIRVYHSSTYRSQVRVGVLRATNP